MKGLDLSLIWRHTLKGMRSEHTGFIEDALVEDNSEKVEQYATRKVA